MIRRPVHLATLKTRSKRGSECCILECSEPRTEGRRSCVDHVPFFDRVRADLAEEAAQYGDRG